MSENNNSFVGWEEHIVCQERGNRVVHFYLKEASGSLLLAVVGTEKSIRHMIYVVSGEFLKAYGSQGFINGSTKWRARREVVEWLQSLVSMDRPLSADLQRIQMDDSARNFESLEVSMIEPLDCQIRLLHHMVVRKLKVQNSDIKWSGIAWICAKQLKHYSSFYRNGTTIAVHSFVLIMAEEKNHYLGYLEDIYEDKKGQKKVKVRWFHNNHEVKSVIPQLNPHPREVFFTSDVQVISAECVDGLATVLTPRHYEKCVTILPQNSQLTIHMCFRQFKNNKVKPFNITKLRGYSNQAILPSLDGMFVPKRKGKNHKSYKEDEGVLTFDDPLRITVKRKRTCNWQNGLEGGTDGKLSVPVHGYQIIKFETTYPKLKLRFSRKKMHIASEPLFPSPFKGDEKIELLCQDSGVRGCWFRCKVLKASQKHLKVRYDDLQDVDGSCNLEEWVLASKVATPDKLSMRCPGRLTIRPCPPNDTNTDCNIEIGAPIDVWWSDGWWEGVTTRVGISGDDELQVYLPDEEKLLIVQRENTRTSKDWVANKWVDIKGKMDILSCLSPGFCPSMNPSSCSTMVETSGCVSITSIERKVLTTSKLETVKEDEQESPKSATCPVMTQNMDNGIQKVTS